MLPPDFHPSVPLDIDPAKDEECVVLVEELACAAPKRFCEVLRLRADSVAAMGSTRRMRVIVWMVHRGWEDGHVILRDLIDDGEEGRGGDGGRSKIAPLFRRDLDALAGCGMLRVVRGVAQYNSAAIILRGVGAYQADYGLNQTGGL